MNNIPEKLINFRVYLDGTDLLGVADVDLPNLEGLTDTVRGAGIAGEIDSPALGHYSPMTLGLNWRTVTGPVTQLAAPKAHHLDLRGSIQFYDAGTGEYNTKSLKVVVKAVPKTTNLGKLDVAKSGDVANEFSINYIKVWFDDKESVEIDPFNFIARVNGEDYLASVRRDLGLV
ncbi:phage major tail tube protein [Acetomicrobium sp. S15 = DSM 107314]|uniref:phage major tail tube protein n=1 Tax=Acetomicrobium sp. S15 = DSM 107314 TaxID=2529858 RepID=UPI0018E1341B|nr:phage major tail tube protein [Acetomicrobium sp. S15 = DSM 107314]